jgi:hypothetical protein
MKNKILKIGIILGIVALIIGGTALVASAINKPNGDDSGWDEAKHPWQEDLKGNIPSHDDGWEVKLLDSGWEENL